MKVRAVILLFCFCSLLEGTESFADYVESLFNSQICSNSAIENALKETDHPSTNTGSNEESCCCGNSVSSVYLLQNAFSYTHAVKPSFKPIAFVVNHYRTLYLSKVWRPPSVSLVNITTNNFNTINLNI
jgi:hypothetical protein